MEQNESTLSFDQLPKTVGELLTKVDYVISRHFDQPHPHIHIVYNRVDNDGNAIKGDTSYTKSAAITKTLTLLYGLTFGKGKDKVRRERLKGKDAIKYRLYDTITAALKDCVTWGELKRLLTAKGISLDYVRNSDGSIRGVTFTDNEHNVTFAGSKIDRSLTSISTCSVWCNSITARATSGGGTSGGWRDDDDDDEKNKHSYIPRKRR